MQELHYMINLNRDFDQILRDGLSCLLLSVFWFDLVTNVIGLTDSHLCRSSLTDLNIKFTKYNLFGFVRFVIANCVGFVRFFKAKSAKEDRSQTGGRASNHEEDTVSRINHTQPIIGICAAR